MSESGQSDRIPRTDEWGTPEQAKHLVDFHRRYGSAMPDPVERLANRLIEGQQNQGGPVPVGSIEDARAYAEWLGAAPAEPPPLDVIADIRDRLNNAAARYGWGRMDRTKFLRLLDEVAAEYVVASLHEGTAETDE